MGRQSRSKAERRAGKAAAAARRAELRRQGAEDGKRRGCLFCRRRDVPFTSFEHVIPESLGNTEKVLPPGVVCDQCNHGICSGLDQALIDFPPIAFMRTTRGVKSKRGKPPTMRFDNGSLHADDAGDLFLQLDSAKWRTQETPTNDGRVKWGFTTQVSGMTPRRYALVHRALLKTTMELAWLDHGEELMLDSRFDRERSIVLNGGHTGYLACPRECDVLDQVECSFTYQFTNTTSGGEHLTMMFASFWGVPIVTDSYFPQPTRPLPEGWANVLRFGEDEERAQTA